MKYFRFDALINWFQAHNTNNWMKWILTRIQAKDGPTTAPGNGFSWFPAMNKSISSTVLNIQRNQLIKSSDEDNLVTYII